MIWDDTQTHTSPRADIDITERTASQLDRLIQALRSGEDHEARVIADAFCDHTPSCTALIETLLAPALRQILVLRADNIVSQYVKQRACAIVHGIVGDHSGCSTQIAGPRSVIATLTGENHRLPARMGAVALREDGWQVEEVSGPLDPEELAEAAIENRLDLVVVATATPATFALADKVKNLLEPAGIPVLVGTLDQSLYWLQRRARRASLATSL